MSEMKIEKQSEIFVELERIKSLVEDLDVNINTLRGAIDPVIIPEEQTNEVPEKTSKERPKSQLARELSDIAVILEAYKQTLQNIYSRCAL